MIEPIVYFGTVNEDEEIDWIEADIIDSPDDDVELEETPSDVIGMLGFDPLDYNENGKLNREKMYNLFNKADTLLGEVETKAKHLTKSLNLLVASPEQISKDFIHRTEEYEKKWVKKARDIFTRQGKEAVKNVEALTQKEIDGYIIRKTLEVKNDKPVLCLDFDDTLFDTETEEPIKGSLDFVNSVVDIFDVQILSGRSATKAGRDEMKQWLKANDFPIDKIGFPEHKPSVDVMLDDRAIIFTGTYPTVEELQDFVPWNKKELQIIKIGKGGPGSGNFSHAGRPGQIGGSGQGGGKNRKDLTWEDFNVDKSKIKRIISNEDNYLYDYGLRVIPSEIDKNIKIGTILAHSYPWNEWDMIKGAEPLKGVSTVGVTKNNIDSALKILNNYMGKTEKTIVLVQGFKEKGAIDPGEFILSNPEVVAIFKRNFTRKEFNQEIITKAKAKKDTWTKEWQALLEVMYPEIIALEGEEIMATMLGGVGIFDVENPNVRDFIDEWKLKLSFEIEDETQRLLKDNIATGMEIGESIPEITTRVRALFEDMSTYRAQRIARTETIRASNYAAEESYRQSGIVTGKVWLVSSDERLCPWCSAMGKKFNNKHPLALGENFASLGESLSYKDENGNKHTMDIDYTDIKAPPLHPHCRCCLTASIDQTLYDEIMSEKKTFTLDELIMKEKPNA